MTSLRRFALWWAALYVLWLLLVATVSPPELIAGMAAAALAAAVATAIARQQVIRSHVRGRWLLNLRRLPNQISHDLVTLTRVLFTGRRPTGVFRALPFDVRGSSPDDVSRRALLAAGASIGPNTFVLGYDDDHQVVLVHQLIKDARVLPIPDGEYPT